VAISFGSQDICHDNLTDVSEISIPRALLKYSVEFILHPHYKAGVTGEMRVVDVDGIKLNKSRDVLIEIFVSTFS